MLISMVEAVSCENPRCKDFARPVELSRFVKTYYCQTCGCTSRSRGVDVRVLASPEKYREFLLKAIKEVDIA